VGGLVGPGSVGGAGVVEAALGPLGVVTRRHFLRLPSLQFCAPATESFMIFASAARSTPTTPTCRAPYRALQSEQAEREPHERKDISDRPTRSSMD